MDEVLPCRLSRKCQIAGDSKPEVERVMGSYYERCPNCNRSSRTGATKEEAIYWWNVFQKTQPNLTKKTV